MSSNLGWSIEDNQQEVTMPSMNKKLPDAAQDQKAQTNIFSKTHNENVMNHPSGNGIQFVVDKNLLPQAKKHSRVSLKQYASLIKYKNNKETKYITDSSNQKSFVEPPLGNGFLGAAIMAYDQHLELVLKPDQVWIAITTAFAHFIDKHAEDMRKHFVNHDGQKTLKVLITPQDENSPEYYIEGIEKLYYAIDEHTNAKIANWFTCNFSTTTQTDQIVSKVILMGAMKHYFKYIMETMCGIPSIWLQGTLEDWKEIRKRAEHIGTYNHKSLVEWSNVLCFILDQFVAAFETKKINPEFWTRIVSQFSTFGSGGGDFLTGWILAFNPFTMDGTYRLNSFTKISQELNFGSIKTHYVYDSAVEVPFIQQGPGGINPRKMLFYAGTLVCDYNESLQQVSPSNQWCLFQDLR